jgi:cell division protein FtsL
MNAAGRISRRMVSSRTEKTMAKKQKKRPQISRRKRRRIQLQQLVFAIIAFVMIATFVISLIG